MSTGPTALFDVEPLRGLGRPTLAVPHRSRPEVVLGSMQRVADLDAASIARDDVGVARRRGGGGAVLLRPDDCWVELWLPSPWHGEDLRRTACMVGEWWAIALGELGVVGSVHRGPVVDADQGAVACFAGLGPGEVTVAGAKLLGLSQWRCREGALVSSVIQARSPDALARYLSDAAPATPALARATCLTNLSATLDASSVAAAFESAVRATMPALVGPTDRFA